MARLEARRYPDSSAVNSGDIVMYVAKRPTLAWGYSAQLAYCSLVSFMKLYAACGHIVPGTLSWTSKSAIREVLLTRCLPVDRKASGLTSKCSRDKDPVQLVTAPRIRKGNAPYVDIPVQAEQGRGTYRTTLFQQTTGLPRI